MAEPQYRFIVAYLLFCYLGTMAYARHKAPQRPSSLGRISIYLTCFVVPAAAYVFLQAVAFFALLVVPDPIRLTAILPASTAILLLVWTHRSWAANEELDAGFCSSGPFRWVRHPATAADSIFFLSLGVIASKLAVLVPLVIGILLLQRHVAAEDDQCSQRWGAKYDEYVANTGRVFFKLGSLKTDLYSIPRRFGLSAAVALITTFGFLFGALNYFQAPPAIYLFCAFEIVAICLGQIVFGSAPRASSCVSGAFTLPICVWLTITRPGWMPEEVYWIGMVFLFFFGGLLGYCLGALAAGFFLVMDLVEPFLPGAES